MLYLLQMVDGIEPVLHGPFRTDKSRLKKAAAIRKKAYKDETNDVVVRIDGLEKGAVTVSNYSASEVDPTFQR